MQSNLLNNPLVLRSSTQSEVPVEELAPFVHERAEWSMTTVHVKKEDVSDSKNYYAHPRRLNIVNREWYLNEGGKALISKVIPNYFLVKTSMLYPQGYLADVEFHDELEETLDTNYLAIPFSFTAKTRKFYFYGMSTSTNRAAAATGVPGVRNFELVGLCMDKQLLPLDLISQRAPGIPLLVSSILTERYATDNTKKVLKNYRKNIGLFALKLTELCSFLSMESYNA